MKKILLLTAIIAAAISTKAQCDEIFISEYVEGTHNNKAIEFYNPTDAPIDLSGYQLERFSNGDDFALPEQQLVLWGTIEPHDVFVFVIEKLNPDGTGTETPVWPELQEKADEFACPVYDENNTMYFNGNDAMVLRKLNGNIAVDIIGTIDQNPADDFGGGWNNIPPTYMSADNGGAPWTENHTMIRKSEVTSGDTTPLDDFNTELEWDTLPVNTFSNLGVHESECNPVSVEEREADKISVYPNPSNGSFTITSTSPFVRIEIYDLRGKKVYTEQLNDGSKTNLISTTLPKGIYVVKGVLENNSTLHSKMTVK